MNPQPITGTLTRAGTFHTNQDGQVTGLVISMTEAELFAVPSLPMYRRVCVVPADMVGDWTVKASEYDKLRSAAQAMWLAFARRTSKDPEDRDGSEAVELMRTWRALGDLLPPLAPKHEDAPVPAEPCRWTADEQQDGFNTTCSQAYCFEHEFTIGKSYNFCPGCGRKIELMKPEETT